MSDRARDWAGKSTRVRAIDWLALVAALATSTGASAQPFAGGGPAGGPTHQPTTQPGAVAVDPAPGSTAWTSETPATTPHTTDESGETDWMLGAGMALSLFGVGTFVIGAYAAAKVGDLGRDPGFEAYRRATPEGQDVCEHAEAGDVFWGAPDPAHITAICDEARTWETVQIVAIPLNVVLGVAGIVLIAKSDTVEGTRPASSAAPVVAVSSRGAFLGVDVPF